MEVIAASSGEGNLSSVMMSWHLLVSSCINSDGVSVADVLLSVLSQVLPLLNLKQLWGLGKRRKIASAAEGHCSTH